MKISEQNWQNSELILYNSFQFEVQRVSLACFRFGEYTLFMPWNRITYILDPLRFVRWKST
jgi:hypothetical protein